MKNHLEAAIKGEIKSNTHTDQGASKVECGGEVSHDEIGRDYLLTGVTQVEGRFPTLSTQTHHQQIDTWEMESDRVQYVW